MKKGMRVMIYNDPISRTNKEGAAKLVKKVGEMVFHEPGCFEPTRVEFWMVKFDGQKVAVKRRVLNG